MRVYLPVSWAQLATLGSHGVLSGPLPACTVPAHPVPAGPVPAHGVAPDEGQPDQEQQEYQAQATAAERLPAPDAGVVLALDVGAHQSLTQDGWLTVTEPVRLRDVAAVFTGDLAWYGVQEIDGLLAGR